LLPNQKTVLIVDDKDSVRSTISLVLGELGYRVRSAADGISALREINQENPDILLFDLNMPGMSGFELVMTVRDLFPAIKVIASSGSFRGTEVPSGVLADAFYSKGSGVNTLLQILRSLPQTHRQAPEPFLTGHTLESGSMEPAFSLFNA
jgi:CheY-like chemotaxis protein